MNGTNVAFDALLKNFRDFYVAGSVVGGRGLMLHHEVEEVTSKETFA